MDIKKIIGWVVLCAVLASVFFLLGRCGRRSDEEYRAGQERIAELESESVRKDEILRTAERNYDELVKIQSELESKYEAAIGELGAINTRLTELGGQDAKTIDRAIGYLEAAERAIRTGKD